MLSRRDFVAGSIASASLMMLGLVGCGSSSSSTNTSSSSGNTNSNSDSDLKSVDINQIICEDDYVTATVEKIYQEVENWGDSSLGKQTESCVKFKITNKSDKKIHFNLGTMYIGDETAWVCGQSGSMVLDAGKNGTFSYIIGLKDGSTHKPLSSLDDIYKLNGKAEVFTYVSADSNTTKSVDTLSIDFSSLKK